MRSKRLNCTDRSMEPSGEGDRTAQLSWNESCSSMLSLFRGERCVANYCSSGQTFMPDYLASLLVFGLLITIFLHSWNSVLQNQTQFEEEEEMRLTGSHTTVFLVSTPGYPEDWNKSSVQIPGFAENDQVLQEEKLEEFRNLSYSRQKELLNPEEFYMSIRNESGIISSDEGELESGNNYSGADIAIPFTRTVQLNLSENIETAERRYVVWN